jgi:EAL domain-containing protein (putative c-di-GMP-specific phosphodiesterase class I)
MAQAPPQSTSSGSLLLVDDDRQLLKAMARVLRHAGYEVDAVANAELASTHFANNHYDAVLTDISLPGMDGIELLQVIRCRNADVPVVLITGMPAVTSAIAAIDNGAYKYLVKPVANDELEAVVKRAVQHSRLAQLRRRAAQVVTAGASPELDGQFDSAIASMWMAYQPIVTFDGTLYGHEALLRSDEPSLPHPGAVLDAAEKLERLHELGRAVRQKAAGPIAADSSKGMLFVNLHPRDLDDEELLSTDSALAKIAPRVVLEITERASVSNIDDLRGKVSTLRSLGYRIAVDDLGAGYAGLTSFALLEPDFVKIDMTLIRDVDTLVVKQRLIRSLTALCSDMGIMVVAEGVETAPERDMLVSLGADLVQGYFIAKPAKPFPKHRW